MYKDVYTIEEGYIVGKITAKEAEDGRNRHSFSLGRTVLGPDKAPRVTYWFQPKHFEAIRKMLDRLELKIIKLEEQAS